MPPQPSTSAGSPGPYWDTYKYFMQWRRVKDGDKEGIVARTGYSTRKLPSEEPSPQDRYEVVWYNAEEGGYDFSTSEPILYPQLARILTNEFLDESEYIPVIVKHLILPLQKANWSVSKKMHDSLVAEAMEVSRKMREELKQCEKQLDTLTAVTDAEMGLQPRPPKPDKPTKKPKTTKAAPVAADSQKSEGGKNKADKGTSRKLTTEADKGKSKATTAAAAAAGPSSSGRAAAAVGSKDANINSKKEKQKKADGSSAAQAAAVVGAQEEQQQQQQRPKSSKKQATHAGSSGACTSRSGGVKGVTGRVYPAEVVFAAGDRKLGTPEYAEDGFADTEYLVAWIVDEIEIVGSKGKRKQVKVLPKWEGFELDPQGWEDKAGLAGVEAYQQWAEKTKPDYYIAVSNDAAVQAFVAWSTRVQKNKGEKR